MNKNRAPVDRVLGWSVRHVLFPLQEFCKRHRTLAVLQQMQTDERLDPGELQYLLDGRLCSFLKDVTTTVPYYRELFEKLNLRAEDIQGVRDLPKIPILTKEVFRRNVTRMKSSRANGVREFSTGGSTGEPLLFLLGTTRISSDVASRMRAEAWWGVGIGDREIVIWGSPLETHKQDWLRSIRDRVMRTRLLSAFEMSPEVMDGYLNMVERARPVRIFGYPSSIAMLCQYACQQGRSLRHLGVEAVFVTGEYLWDTWRQIISQTFGCAVANGYGGRDSGFIAQECPAGGMHITADRIVVEIIGDDGQRLPMGEVGEIIITHLDTPEMPFIRYATGDLGALSAKSCACGCRLPLLHCVEGRKTDFIVAPDGRIMHGLAFIYILREIRGISQFRITQRHLRDFVVEVVKDTAYDASSEHEIRQAISRRLRATVSVEIAYVPKIAPAASGKHRYIVCDTTAPDIAVHLEAVGLHRAQVDEMKQMKVV